MNALQLIQTVINSGGRLWSDGTKLHYRANAEVIEALLPELKLHKLEILKLIVDTQTQPASANTEAARAGIKVYKITVDGKQITAIDPTNKSTAEFKDGAYKRFGAGRVSEIKRVIH